MSSMTGENIKLSVFGESHGEAIGCVLDGLPAGEELDFSEILKDMDRRAPGKDKASTTRRESDTPKILSGLFGGKTTGSPLAMIIENTNQHSGDYADLSRFPRPGHADFTAVARYGGFSDYRGGGHFSGRLTAPIVFAGAVARQILARRGVFVGAHIYSVGEVLDTPFDPVAVNNEDLTRLRELRFSVNNPEKENEMRAVIEKARLSGDSIGGIVECAAVGMPVGIGDPMFGGVENIISRNIFGIPAVKGIEFGAGFDVAKLHGSENNDEFIIKDGKVATRTNNHGGILGGITSGMPIIFRAAFKPTPSIYKEQNTVDLKEIKETKLTIKGRHDPCIVVRAVPAVEAMTAFSLLDMLLGGEKK